jgi:hypothetical protein
MDDRIGMEILAELKKLNDLFLKNKADVYDRTEEPIQFKPKRETRGRKAKDKSNITAKPRAYVRKKTQP